MVIFRGGAIGEEAPVRTIQGARTGLSRPETVAVDEKNNEIFVGDPGDRRVLVYKRDADGDASPLRTIQGDKTKLLQIVGIAVDPVRDLLVVSTYSRLPGGVTGLLIFERTDDRATSRRSGSSPGRKPGSRGCARSGSIPRPGGSSSPRSTTSTCRPYDIDKPRAGLPADVELPSPWNTGSEGFIGVWNDEGDDGDVPPHSVIKGRSTGIVHPAGVTFNAEGRRGDRARRGLERPVHLPEAGALQDAAGSRAMIRRLLAILGRRTMLTFGLVTFLVGALLATVNITSRYALKVYVDDQLKRIPWDLAVYQQGAVNGDRIAARRTSRRRQA